MNAHGQVSPLLTQARPHRGRVRPSRPLLGKLGGYLEYAGVANLSGDADYRGYFDAGLTYGLTPDVQLDGGIRVGLTEAADDLGVFAGISLRL